MRDEIWLSSHGSTAFQRVFDDPAAEEALQHPALALEEAALSWA